MMSDTVCEMTLRVYVYSLVPGVCLPVRRPRATDDGSRVVGALPGAQTYGEAESLLVTLGCPTTPSDLGSMGGR